jgi:predicted membrane protein
MGELSLAVDSQQFKGGSLGATMGEIKLDLRRAAIAGDEVVLELRLLMSSVELYVPSHWRVVNDIAPMMAEVEDKTEHRPDGAGVQKRLVLRGSVTMAAVTVRN